MFENPRRSKQARNFTTNVPKILDLKSSSEQIFSRKLSLGAPEFRELQRNKVHVNETSGLFLCLMAGLRWWCFPMLSDFFVEDVR